jgi:hypothetical protein
MSWVMICEPGDGLQDAMWELQQTLQSSHHQIAAEVLVFNSRILLRLWVADGSRLVPLSNEAYLPSFLLQLLAFWCVKLC